MSEAALRIMSTDQNPARASRAVWRQARLLTLRDERVPLEIIEKGAVVVDEGRIVFAGSEDHLTAGELEVAHDCEGRLLTPALIDCHTHLVYGGNRAQEFERRLNGETYQEIARSGGGIAATVRATNAASESELLATALARLDDLLAQGVSTVEIKSGYALNVDGELRMLRVARKLEALRPVRIKTSYLAAHSVPKEYTGHPDDYLSEVVLPGLEQAHAEGLVDAVDVFCENIAFRTAHVSRLFDRARELGVPMKIHAEQLSNSGGARLAASYGAMSADHLEYLDREGALAMAQAGTTAVLLPGAYYTLRENQLPPIAALREFGVPMAIATDCNPGTSPLTSLLLAMNFGATLFKMTIAECIVGATKNAARALGITRETGSLMAGMSADFAIWDVAEPAELVYRMGARPLSQRVHAGVPVER